MVRSTVTHGQSEEKRKRRLKRKIIKKIFQIAPCGMLLSLCWLIIHIQKQQVKMKLTLNDIGVDKASTIKDDHQHGQTQVQHEEGEEEEEDNLDPVNRYPFNGLADITQPKLLSQTGLYWQIPKTGGTTLKHTMAKCLNLVQASRSSVDLCDVKVDDLHVCYTRQGAFVNADTSDNHGIQRASELNLIPSGLADVVVSSRFLHTLALFDLEHPARAFTVMRDPIERIVSTFYYLQKANWERHFNAKYKDITLLAYVESDDVGSDWMVRWLTGKQNEQVLTDQDLAFAKQILQRKFLILLTEEMEESVNRLLQFMGWNINEEGKACLHDNLSKVARHNKNLHPEIEVGSAEYNAMREKNRLDTQLYDFALGLYSEQWKLVPQ